MKLLKSPVKLAAIAALLATISVPMATAQGNDRRGERVDRGHNFIANMRNGDGPRGDRPRGERPRGDRGHRPRGDRGHRPEATAREAIEDTGRAETEVTDPARTTIM